MGNGPKYNRAVHKLRVNLLSYISQCLQVLFASTWDRFERNWKQLPKLFITCKIIEMICMKLLSSKSFIFVSEAYFNTYCNALIYIYAQADTLIHSPSFSQASKFVSSFTHTLPCFPLHVFLIHNTLISTQYNKVCLKEIYGNRLEETKLRFCIHTLDVSYCNIIWNPIVFQRIYPSTKSERPSRNVRANGVWNNLFDDQFVHWATVL